MNIIYYHYSKDLESTVQDPTRGVRVRRLLLGPDTRRAGALQVLPYLGLDYSKVISLSDGWVCQAVIIPLNDQSWNLLWCTRLLLLFLRTASWIFYNWDMEQVIVGYMIILMFYLIYIDYLRSTDYVRCVFIVINTINLNYDWF